MKVKQYRAELPRGGAFRSAQEGLEAARRECIARARADLGPGAVFLNEETRVEERWFGWRRRAVVEMLFAADLEEAAALPAESRALLFRRDDTGGGAGRGGEPAAALISPAAVPGNAAPAAARAGLEDEVRELAETVRTLSRDVVAAAATTASVPSASIPAAAIHPELRARLESADVPEPILAELLAALPAGTNPDETRRALRRAVEAAFRTVRFEETATAGADAVPLGRRVVAFVGPTGVGKTTTIAKLAAPLALAAQQGREHGRRVGLVILDTYRIAAVEQLKTYGEIMDVPVRVAQGTRGIGAALDALADRDLVFVDTAGRSQKDHEQIAALRRALDDTPCEPHLVVSATAKPTDLLECARVFGVLRPRSLLVTKLDETNTLGPLLALVRESGLGISFVTSGQRVPEDIEPADPARLAARLLGE